MTSAVRANAALSPCAKAAHILTLVGYARTCIDQIAALCYYLMWLVAGRVGFGYDMGAVSEAAGEGAGKIANVLEITDAAAAEVEKRWGEPYRVWQFWKKVLPICHFKCTIS